MLPLSRGDGGLVSENSQSSPGPNPHCCLLTVEKGTQLFQETRSVGRREEGRGLYHREEWGTPWGRPSFRRTAFRARRAVWGSRERRRRPPGLRPVPAHPAGGKRKCDRRGPEPPPPLAGRPVSRLGAEAEKRKKELGAPAWKGGRRAEPGGVGAGTAGRRAGRGCLRSGHFSHSALSWFRVALCVPACGSRSPKRGEAEPRALGRFSREDSLPPRSRLLSPEPRSEWKPSPNMTSKPPQTTS